MLRPQPPPVDQLRLLAMRIAAVPCSAPNVTAILQFQSTATNSYNGLPDIVG